MENALEIASGGPGALGIGLGLAAGLRRFGLGGWVNQSFPPGWCGMGTADTIASRSAREVQCAMQQRARQRQTPPVTARTDGGGRRGAWHQLGLLMGIFFTGCQPAQYLSMFTGEEDDLLAGTTTVPCDAQRQTWSAEPNRAARAGQSRPGSGGQVAQDGHDTHTSKMSGTTAPASTVAGIGPSWAGST